MNSKSGDRRIENLVVDANPLLAALLGGKALHVFQVLESQKTTSCIAVPTMGEVLEYLPLLAVEKALPLEKLFEVLRNIRLKIFSPEYYRSAVREAASRIAQRDPKDVDPLALSLFLNAPLWTNDRDFEGVGIPCYSTSELLNKLRM